MVVMRPRPSQHEVLGTALFLGLLAGAASFWATFGISFNFALRTGLISLHFERTPSSFEENAFVYGASIVSVLVGILIAVLTFRSVMRFGLAHSRG